MPKHAHLYHVNGVYIPASFVLYKIYNSLAVVYQDIVGEVEDTFHYTNTIKGGKSSVSINNNTSYEDIGTYSDFSLNTIREKWVSVGKKSAENTRITFLFISGLLDILDGIKEAFSF